MPDKSKNKFILNQTNNLNQSSLNKKELLDMINQYQKLNNNKVYRNVYLTDIQNHNLKDNDTKKKESEKLVKNKIQGEYGEKKFIKP